MQPDDEQPTRSVGVFASDDGEDDTTIDDRLGPGSEVGGYVVEGVLGQGGMGFVYAAVHPLIGKRAAIKVLRPELSKEPAAVERFVREARAVNQIGHPNIVDIFAFGNLTDGRNYYVMDLLVGESLRARLKRTGALHISEAASVIDETASALSAAHAKGLIHRDLKPDNVFMVSVPGRWPEVRLLDWGLVKLVSSNAKYRTLAGSVMGTPVYMSPEQARASDSVDFRTDIYALGVMSYELLSGTVPFKKGSSIDTLLAHQDEPVPSLQDRVPGLPDELVQLIEAMLAKDADGRPTLAAVQAVLKRLKGTKIPTMTAAGLPMLQPISSGVIPLPDEATLSDRTMDEKMSAQLTVPLLRGPEPGAFPLPVPEASLPPPQPYYATQPPAYSMPPGSLPPSYSYSGHAQGSLPPQAQPYPSLQPQAQPYPALPPTPPETGSRRWLVIVAVAVLGTVLGIVVALLA